MTARTTVYPTTATQEKARVLVANRHQWRYVRNIRTGVSFVTVPSGDHVYQVHPFGRGCSCPAYQKGGLVCSHRLAVIEAHNQDALVTWTTEVAARPTCQAPGCQAPIDPREHSCSRHQLVDAY